MDASSDQADRFWTVTELARELGVTPRTIRFYEDRGLILPRRAPLRGPRIVPAALAGGLWAVGNALMLRSTAAVGVASGFTLSQLGFVLATLGGLTILGEERTGRERTAVAAGVAAAVVGLVLMGLATGMDTGASPSQ